jgi:CDP-glycerol glycerophosphotransferase
MTLSIVRKARRLGRRLRRGAQFERLAWARSRPVVPGQVLYESFAGNGMLDSPGQIFRDLLAAPDMQHLQHVWALKDLEQYGEAVERYRNDARVRFVIYGSPAYLNALARSQYLVNNATFPPEFGKREGQVYLNTWHGTPLKRMGYDIPGGGPATRNVIRNFVSADFLLSSCDFMTEQMYLTAYKLRGIYRGRIIQEGMPRVDPQFAAPDEREEVRHELVRRGVSLDPDQKIILFAPTWKGDYYSPLNDTKQLISTVHALNSHIDTRRYRVLVKAHQRVFDFASARPELRDALVPNDIPTNLVLGATDILITDYSSIFFDFLVTGRPLLFHVPDEASYAESRGLYLPSDEWPGPVSRTIDELAATVNAVGTGGPDDPAVTHHEVYRQARATYSPHEDGQAASRVIDIVFRDKADGYNVLEDFSDGRTSILMYMGGLLNNGITNSALNLLNNIDHSRLDVSVCYSHSQREDRVHNESLINPNVRLFPRIGGIAGSKFYKLGRHALMKKGLDSRLASLQRKGLMRRFRDEWRRCFGMSKFDHIIDFSGYGPFWPCVLMQGEAETKTIWLHNDMLADSQREIKGHKPLEQGLKAVFTLYGQFDHLVSVSEALASVNRRKLAAYAPPEKFVSALNTIDYERTLQMAYGVDKDSDGPNAERLRERPENLMPLGDQDRSMVAVDSLPHAIETLMSHFPLQEISGEVERRKTILEVVPPATGRRTFVAAGRLSPEKNHARLIRAFNLVHLDYPSTRLVIMGSGPLEPDLEELIANLGLATVATLAGWQRNPYAVMANSDCFVMSSNYEGQGIVILEAMVLGLPVVSTNFEVVRGALPEDYGIVVDQCDEALAEGMRAFLRGDVPAPPFDYVRYNREAVEQFYEAIGAASAVVHGETGPGTLAPHDPTVAG